MLDSSALGVSFSPLLGFLTLRSSATLQKHAVPTSSAPRRKKPGQPASDIGLSRLTKHSLSTNKQKNVRLPFVPCTFSASERGLGEEKQCEGETAETRKSGLERNEVFSTSSFFSCAPFYTSQGPRHHGKGRGIVVMSCSFPLRRPCLLRLYLIMGDGGTSPQFPKSFAQPNARCPSGLPVAIYPQCLRELFYRPL